MAKRNSIFMFFMFWHLCISSILIILWICIITFFDHFCVLAIGLRPYCNCHKREIESYVWWFSPHVGIDEIFSLVVVLIVGEISQERSNNFYTLVLPSFSFWFLFVYVSDLVVGEITQESSNNDTLVLPSLNRIVCIYRLSVLISCRGDYTGDGVII